MMRWRAYRGSGSPLTAPARRRLLRVNPSGRTLRTWEKNGSKRHNLREGSGVPLSRVASGANTHDSKMLETVLDERVHSPPEGTEQNLCLDAAYVGKDEIVEKHGFKPHIRPRGRKKRKPGAVRSANREDGLSNRFIHGRTGSENSRQGMKKRTCHTWGCCILQMP